MHGKQVMKTTKPFENFHKDLFGKMKRNLIHQGVKQHRKLNGQN